MISAQFVSLPGLELPYYIVIVGAGVLKLTATEHAAAIENERRRRIAAAPHEESLLAAAGVDWAIRGDNFAFNLNMKPVVRIDRLSKLYRIGTRRNAAYRTLRRDGERSGGRSLAAVPLLVAAMGGPRAVAK